MKPLFKRIRCIGNQDEFLGKYREEDSWLSIAIAGIVALAVAYAACYYAALVDASISVVYRTIGGTNVSCEVDGAEYPAISKICNNVISKGQFEIKIER
jgi:hypothetical protein